MERENSNDIPVFGLASGIKNETTLQINMLIKNSQTVDFSFILPSPWHEATYYVQGTLMQITLFSTSCSDAAIGITVLLPSFWTKPTASTLSISPCS